MTPRPPCLNPGRRLPPRSTRGFSLMEILITAAVLAVLLAISSSMSGSWRSQQILAAATRLSQDIQLARSLALKRGQPVEIRFYSNKDFSLTTPDPQYKTWQIVGYDSREERLVRLGELQRFDSTVILSRFPTLSSVLSNERPLDPSRDPIPSPLPTRMASIEFRPDGSTTLDPDPSFVWTLTLLTDGFARETHNLPPDFRTLIISADNGSVSVY
jgi:uncharacterized protein (TIGR02596 family)